MATTSRREEVKIGLFKALFDLSRGKQALLSVAQPALGALLALGAIPGPKVLISGLAAATCGYLAVFSLNDLLDRRSDRAALAAGKDDFEGVDIDTTFLRHPLAAGHLSFGVALVWTVSLASVCAVLAYQIKPVCFYLFLGCAGLEAVYCSLRSITWMKTVVSGWMVGLGGLAGWAAVAPIGPGALIFFSFLALWEVFGRNLPNDLADLEADGRVGIQTVAVVYGGRVSSFLILLGSALVMGTVALLPVVTSLAVTMLAIAAWSMWLPAIRLARNPSSDQAASYFNRASLFPALAFLAVLVYEMVGALR